MDGLTNRTAPLTADAHKKAMEEYGRAAEARAYALGNRGPIRFVDGKLDPAIAQSYWTHGFYVLQGVVGPEELAELRAAVDRTLDRAPVAPDAKLNKHGRPALGEGIIKPPYRWAKPLSDPLGGTDKFNGRHPSQMVQPTLGADAPELTIERLDGNLHLMDECLRLYGHPSLLAVAAAILGDDFVPYNEVTFIKEPGLGPSVAWHRDGMTHWTSPDWNMGAHGFNFMTQLYPSTAGNGVWVIPGTHRDKTVDIKKLMEDAGSDRLPTAMPLLCNGGDTIVTNRQLVHGSFANSSPDRRVTLNAGFFPRQRVLGVTAKRLHGVVETFDEARIVERSRIIQLAIDARRQRFPNEKGYAYRPMAGHEDENRWTEAARETLLKNYNQRDMFI